MDFESLIQNLFGISKCALNQCYRELNFEQLWFWDQLLKMPFSSSKFEFETVLENLELKFEKEKCFRASGPRAPLPAQQPKSARPAPARLPRAHPHVRARSDNGQSLAAAWPYITGAGRPVAHRGPHGRATPPK
jgi:hypothetical protein